MSYLFFIFLSIKITNQKPIFILRHIIILSNYLSINILNKKRAFTGSRFDFSNTFPQWSGNRYTGYYERSGRL